MIVIYNYKLRGLYLGLLETSERVVWCPLLVNVFRIPKTSVSFVFCGFDCAGVYTDDQTTYIIPYSIHRPIIP